MPKERQSFRLCSPDPDFWFFYFLNYFVMNAAAPEGVPRIGSITSSILEIMELPRRDSKNLMVLLLFQV